MTHDHLPGPDHGLDDQVGRWLAETDLTPIEANAGLGRLLDDFAVTPQARRRSLGRWLDRDEGAGRRATERDHAPQPDRRTRLMFSASGTTAGLAILVLAISSMNTMQAPPNTGATYLVGSGVAAEYPSIQAAVDAAADGDTIELEPGEYVGSVTIDKDVTIVGDPADPSRVRVVIPRDGPQVRVGDQRMNFAFELQDVEASIGGLTIHGPGLRTTAFVVRGGSPTIHDVDVQLEPLQTWPRAFAYVMEARGEIRDSSANAEVSVSDGSVMKLTGNTTTGADLTNGFGVYVWGTLTDVDFSGNRLNGISVNGGAHATVQQNEIVAADGCGLESTGAGSTLLAVGNVVRANETGICTSGRGSATIEDNEVFDNGTGISLGSDDASVSSNAIRANDVGLLVRVGNPAIVGNAITENRAGLALGSLPTAPTLTANELCANEVNVEVPEGIEPPSLDGNDVC
jgi:hypothetical protein